VNKPIINENENKQIINDITNKSTCKCINILIVDDDGFNIWTLKKLLE